VVVLDGADVVVVDVVVSLAGTFEDDVVETGGAVSFDVVEEGGDVVSFAGVVEAEDAPDGDTPEVEVSVVVDGVFEVFGLVEDCPVVSVEGEDVVGALAVTVWPVVSSAYNMGIEANGEKLSPMIRNNATISVGRSLAQLFFLLRSLPARGPRASRQAFLLNSMATS
jgi:hypothetical protein